MKSITITAHTGCENTPENSLEAIEKGASLGADIVEFDIRFDKNNNPILSHDEPTGGEVTLEQAFEKLSEYENLKVNLDIKCTTNLYAVQTLAEKYNLLDRAFYTGVFAQFVDAVKTDSPKLPYFLNITDVIPSDEHTEEYLLSLVEKVKSYGAMGINFHFDNASKALVETFHKNNLQVSIWTVNEIEDFKRIIDFAPDNITTKFPGIAKTLI